MELPNQCCEKPKVGGMAHTLRPLVLLLSLLASLLAAPALAGDRALIDSIGFSEDHRYFAFEEFGIQDGSGFAYANLYVVDLASDSWVPGTPVRVQADDENESLVDIRAEARRLAESHIEQFRIAVPVETIALIGDGVPDNDGQSLDFGLPGFEPGAVRGAYSLSLSSFPAKAASPCQDWFGMEPRGYQLQLMADGAERLLHRDETLPRSRGCPFTYRLYGVVMPFMANSLDNAVALISVYPGGFEGPDRRFLAVPLAP